MHYYPLKFSDVFKDKIWGGDALGRVLDKAVPAGSRVGESWEASTHTNGPSLVVNGPLAGKTLSRVIANDPSGVLGARLAAQSAEFPLLFKFIDANDKLSIQVHPDDDYSRRYENENGKTEAWYVAHADPGARMICGLKRALSKSEVEGGIRAGNLETLLNEFPVKTGDTVFVPAGTVHAIEAGTLIYEVQESSDVTYRLYDWNRMVDDGKPRDLHVEKSLAVMNYNDTQDHRTRPFAHSGKGFVRECLAACVYFALEKWTLEQDVSITLGNSGAFEVLTVLEGSAWVGAGEDGIKVSIGETLLIPAGLGQCPVRALKAPLVLLRTWVPESVKKYSNEWLSLGAEKRDIMDMGGLT